MKDKVKYTKMLQENLQLYMESGQEDLSTRYFSWVDVKLKQGSNLPMANGGLKNSPEITVIARLAKSFGGERDVTSEDNVGVKFPIGTTVANVKKFIYALQKAGYNEIDAMYTDENGDEVDQIPF